MNALLTIVVLPSVLLGGLALLAALALVAVALARRSAAGDPRTPDAAVGTALGTSTLLHVAAWLVVPFLLGCGALLANAARTYPAVVALVPLLVALTFLTTFALGEAAWQRPNGRRRTAGLRQRSVTTVAPPRLRALALALPVIALPGVLLGGLTAVAPGTLRRLVTLPDARNAWLFGEPYPSWQVGLAVLGSLLVIAGAGEALVRAITSRPAVVGVPATFDLDLRRLTAHRVLRGTVLVEGVTVAALYGALGTAWVRVEVPVLGWALVVVGGQVAAVTLGAVCRPVGIALGADGWSSSYDWSHAPAPEPETQDPVPATSRGAGTGVQTGGHDG